VSDEATVVLGILGIIVVMIVVLVRQQRRKEARLAALAEIEIPIQSTWRSVLIIIPSLAAAPVLVAVVAAHSDHMRQHAVAGVLSAIGLGVVGMFAGLGLSRRCARIGLLRYAPPLLELQLGSQRWHVDLEQPYELAEASAFGTGSVHLQVLAVRQGERVVAFSYGLPLGRKPYGDHAVDRHVEPLVDAEARVVHDRLRRVLETGRR
jgi:hypothetical protein